MALSSKITEIYIRNQGTFSVSGDWKYRIKAHNFNNEFGLAFFNSAYDEAIDGSLRTNVRGFRLTVDLSQQKLLTTTVDKRPFGGLWADSDMSALFDDIITELAINGDSYIQISFDDSNWYNVIPDSATYATAYSNQIGRGSANIKLIGQGILTSIPSALEAPSV